MYYKSLDNVGTAAGITGRTINEKCPIHQGVDTVEVDNDRGRAEWFQSVKSLVAETRKRMSQGRGL